MNILCKIFGHKMSYAEPNNVASASSCIRKNCNHAEPAIQWPTSEEEEEV